MLPYSYVVLKSCYIRDMVILYYGCVRVRASVKVIVKVTVRVPIRANVNT